MGNARYVGDYLFVAILTSLATWVVPVGMFDSQEVQYQVDGQTKTRKVVDPHSFRILTNEAGEPGITAYSCSRRAMNARV